MFMSLMKAFSMSGEPDKLKLYPRQVNLSDNVFYFEIPEDFSRDMPADDLVEQLDLENATQLRNEGYVTLMRRWWDIKKPGLWGKNMGTVMMSITVRASPENQAGILKAGKYDFHSMLHFVVALYDSLEQRWREHNQEVSISGDDDFRVYVPPLANRVGTRLDSAYKGVIRHGKKWLDTGAAQARQVYDYYALPINDKDFLEIEFALMPNDNVIAREFVDLAMIRVNKITETFDLQYAKDNEFDRVTGKDWIDKTVLDELESNDDQFLPGVKQ